MPPLNKEDLARLKKHGPEDVNEEEPENEISLEPAGNLSGRRDLDLLVMADFLKREKRLKVTIPSTETDKEPVRVGLNGYVYNIPRDKEVKLPISVVKVLQQAVMTTYSIRKREGDDEGNELIPREVMRFPLQILAE